MVYNLLVLIVLTRFSMYIDARLIVEIEIKLYDTYLLFDFHKCNDKLEMCAADEM